MHILHSPTATREGRGRGGGGGGRGGGGGEGRGEGEGGRGSAGGRSDIYSSRGSLLTWSAILDLDRGRLSTRRLVKKPRLSLHLQSSYFSRSV